MDYYFGHSPVELERLIAQASVLRPITERLLLKAGLRPGMRVLDVGCGAGDVSILVAERVGPQGEVVGTDASPKAIELARQRAVDLGYDNMQFTLANDPAFLQAEPFDFVIGRYAVMHQEDPVTFIRAAAARLRRGGIIAFHDIDLRTTFQALPSVPAFDRIARELLHALRIGVPTPDAAGRFVALFTAAGLPVPKLFCERPIGGGPDSSLYRWTASTYAAVRSLTHSGEPPVDIDRLEDDLREAVIAANAQIIACDQCCAWVRI